VIQMSPILQATAQLSSTSGNYVSHLNRLHITERNREYLMTISTSVIEQTNKSEQRENDVNQHPSHSFIKQTAQNYQAAQSWRFGW